MASLQGEIAGGLWNTTKPEEQEAVLAQQFYTLFFTLATHDIPVTLLHFPRLINEPEYLYEKIGFLLGNMRYDVFLRGFQAVCRPELVHDFHADRVTKHA